jgi:hypothetical protein
LYVQLSKDMLDLFFFFSWIFSNCLKHTIYLLVSC